MRAVAVPVAVAVAVAVVYDKNGMDGKSFNLNMDQMNFNTKWSFAYHHQDKSISSIMKNESNSSFVSILKIECKRFPNPLIFEWCDWFCVRNSSIAISSSIHGCIWMLKFYVIFHRFSILETFIDLFSLLNHCFINKGQVHVWKSVFFSCLLSCWSRWINYWIYNGTKSWHFWSVMI